MEEGRSAFKILTGKPTGKKYTFREVSAQMGGQYLNDLEDIGINEGNWVDSAQDRDC